MNKYFPYYAKSKIDIQLFFILKKNIAYYLRHIKIKNEKFRQKTSLLIMNITVYFSHFFSFLLIKDNGIITQEGNFRKYSYHEC